MLDHFTERDPAATAEGVAASMAALATGRVDTLFVADNPDDDRTAWYSPHLLCTAHDIRRLDGRWRAARLTDVAVRALLTDADVRVGTGSLGDDIGALCRYTPSG